MPLTFSFFFRRLRDGQWRDVLPRTRSAEFFSASLTRIFHHRTTPDPSAGEARDLGYDS